MSSPPGFPWHPTAANKQMQRSLFKKVFPEDAFRHELKNHGLTLTATSKSPSALGDLLKFEIAHPGPTKIGIRAARKKQGTDNVYVLADVEARHVYRPHKPLGRRNVVSVSTAMFQVCPASHTSKELRVRHCNNKNGIKRALKAWDAADLKELVWEEHTTHVKHGSV